MKVKTKHKIKKNKKSAVGWDKRLVWAILFLVALLFTAEVASAQITRYKEQERLKERKEKLRNYFAGYGSPFTQDDQALEAFAVSKNTKMMVAISFVESTFGRHCYYYNCSGIGGTPPTLRQYNSYAEWIYDFDKLLEEHYKNIPPEDFMGLYVQPGSPNWLYGVKQVLRELEEQGI